MSLGKAMVHARKQKAIARAVALAAEHASGQHPTQSIHILQMPVLVLNASYEPINICGARRALVLVLKGIARTEEEHGLMLHAQRSRIPMPSVIRLLEYRAHPSPDPRPFAKEYPVARPQHLPVLRRSHAAQRAHSRSRGAAFPRR